jgi:hypothetical protein
MKRHSYPHFVATGLVKVFEHGETRQTITVQATCFIAFQWEAYRLLERDCKYRLELAGVPKERLESLLFETDGITEITACNAKGVKQEWGERVEAFLDHKEIKKRDLLIRQRRLVPYDHEDMLHIYGPKVPAHPTTTATKVSA